MGEKFFLKPYSHYDVYHKRSFHDLLVVEVDTGIIRGFFLPPQPGEIYTTVLEPELITNLQDFPDHANVKFFTIDPLGLTPDWYEQGFEVEEALTWKATARVKAAAALAWKTAGFTPEDVIPWQKVEVKDAVVARKLVDAGIPRDTLKSWRMKPTEIVEWTDQGFDAQTVQEWRKQKMSPTEAKAWQQEQVTPDDAARWRSLGMNVATSQPLRAQNTSPLSILQAQAQANEIPPKDEAILFWGFDFPDRPDRPPVPEHRLQTVISHGCKVDFYGKPANVRFFYVTVAASELRIPYTRQIHKLSPPTIAPDWDEQLRQFCQETNIEWQQPGWHLATLWESS